MAKFHHFYKDIWKKFLDKSLYFFPRQSHDFFSLKCIIEFKKKKKKLVVKSI